MEDIYQGQPLDNGGSTTSPMDPAVQVKGLNSFHAGRVDSFCS